MNQEPLDFAAALSLLRAAREEITRLRALRPEDTHWISVEEKLPLSDDAQNKWELVIVLDAEGTVRAADYWADDKKFWPPNGKGEYWGSEYDNITHWQPLPPPPQEGS